MNLLLQIVFPDGRVFQMPAGGPLEMDLENKLAERLKTKRVGIFSTADQVEASFREAFREVMHEFKDKVANPV